MKLTTLTIHRWYSVLLSSFVLLCSYHHHSSPELFLSCKTETLYPLNNNSPFTLSPQPLATSLLLSVSMNLTPYISGIIQCFSFGDWLISLSIMSSRSAHIVAHVRISFLLKVEYYWPEWLFRSVCSLTGLPGRLCRVWLILKCTRLGTPSSLPGS